MTAPGTSAPDWSKTRPCSDAKVCVPAGIDAHTTNAMTSISRHNTGVERRMAGSHPWSVTLCWRLGGEMPRDHLFQIQEHPLLAEGLAQWRAPHRRQHIRGKANEPHRDAALFHACLTFRQHFEDGVFHVEHGTQVQRDDTRLSFVDQHQELFPHPLAIDEEQPAD